MKKCIYFCFVVATVGLVASNIQQQVELKECNRLVMDLQSTIRMMEDEIIQANVELNKVVLEYQFEQHNQLISND